MKKKHRLARDERQRCIKAAEKIVQQYEGMGFRHNADKAAGARLVLDAIRLLPADDKPHTVCHVAGLTTVYES